MSTRVTGTLATVRDALSQNVGYRLVALLFSLALWVFVQSEQRVEDRVRAAVTWTLPEGMSLVEPPIEQVTLTVEGVQALVRSLPQRELAINVDLSRATEGDVAVDLAQRKIAGLPAQLQVLAVSPAQLRVTLDRQFKRKVTVSPTTVGQVPPGYRVAGLTVSPERAEILGPVSVLRGIDSVGTQDVDITGLREDGDFEVGLALRKGLSTAGKNGRFTVHVDVEAILAERTYESVPVLIRDARYTPSVATVRVVLSGPAEAVGDLADDDLSVMVYIPDGWSEAAGEARHGKQDGPRYEVVHGGGEGVSVVTVTPDRIGISRKAE